MNVFLLALTHEQSLEVRLLVVWNPRLHLWSKSWRILWRNFRLIYEIFQNESLNELLGKSLKNTCNSLKKLWRTSSRSPGRISGYIWIYLDISGNILTSYWNSSCNNFLRYSYRILWEEFQVVFLEEFLKVYLKQLMGKTSRLIPETTSEAFLRVNSRGLNGRIS